MTRLEQIARDLAAVLSPQGEEDWRRFLGLAEKVGVRLDRQFVDILVKDIGSSPRGQRPETRAAGNRYRSPSGRRS